MACRATGNATATCATIARRSVRTESSRARYNRRVHFVYIVRCADGTLYTGYARDPRARERAHNSGRGAKYTAGRRPVQLVYQEAFRSVGKALAREYAVKQLTRAQKDALVVSGRRPPLRPSPTPWTVVTAPRGLGLNVHARVPRRICQGLIWLVTRRPLIVHGSEARRSTISDVLDARRTRSASRVPSNGPTRAANPCSNRASMKAAWAAHSDWASSGFESSHAGPRDRKTTNARSIRLTNQQVQTPSAYGTR